MTNETKQTAVEWLESIFYSQSKSVGFDKWVIIESEMDRIIDKAKEMEREQNENYLKAYFEWHKSMGFISHKPEDISEFNETYKRR